jgi:hypothetical protein
MCSFPRDAATGIIIATAKQSKTMGTTIASLIAYAAKLTNASPAGFMWRA